MKTIGSRLTAENQSLTDSRESVLHLHVIHLNVSKCCRCMLSVQPNNRSINRYRKRSGFIHSHEMETLLKFVETRARRIKSDANKLLAREKAESWVISRYRHESLKHFYNHFVAQCVAKRCFVLDASV